ncbi:GtrA family protein, partial [Devosia sp. ZW T5_3]|uniref:GtrA family protein n=1 Tax=Devosia sp. ZW T5_3 TaxID=3378085 RepID=UPI0038547C58
MTGFFLVDRSRLDLETLRPQGFKILLEILARTDLRIAEVPMEFAERRHGTSKASIRQGTTFLAHLARLRFGKMSLFALIGALGALANLGIMWVLTEFGMPYVWAAIIGIVVGIAILIVQRRRHLGLEPSPYQPGRGRKDVDADVESQDNPLDYVDV